MSRIAHCIAGIVPSDASRAFALQSDYHLDNEEDVRLINIEAAKLAKGCTQKWMEQHPGSRKFVAGAVGPTSKTLSVSPSVENPAFRGTTYDAVEEAYYEQIEALYDGGVDMFLVETIFDTLNSKAAIYALERFFEHKQLRLPVFISGTIVDNSGRTLSGQTNEAFWNSICHSKPMAVGLNCALGAKDMKPYVDNLSKCADCYVFCYPNAGLPNAMGGYDQKGSEMAEEIRPFCEEQLVNCIGGCCGTGPEHIAAIKAMAEKYEPRKKHAVESKMRLSGLEPLNYQPKLDNMRSTFINIGERCNVAGSSIYKKAIVDGNYDKAAAIAVKQVCVWSTCRSEHHGTSSLWQLRFMVMRCWACMCMLCFHMNFWQLLQLLASLLDQACCINIVCLVCSAHSLMYHIHVCVCVDVPYVLFCRLSKVRMCWTSTWMMG